MGQLDLRFGQVPLEEAIRLEKNPRYKKLLSSIPLIKAFAVKRVLLRPSDCYTGYYSTTKPGIAFVVTASRKDKLDPYTWWFPIVGAVPYKGFFNREDALELEKELKDEGLDTWLFTTVAYSSLGWFKDPLTTPMIRKGYYYLTETIIHEMTHSTLYVNGKGDFNEQLATFVGQTGAYQYFRENHLLGEEELRRIEGRKKRNLLLNRTVRKYVPRLRFLFEKRIPLKELLERREAIFDELANELCRLFPGLPKSYWRFNNARILQYQRYEPESALFREIWEKSRHDWSLFWKRVSRYVKEQGWST
jgi:predicted aminopeptidase